MEIEVKPFWLDEKHPNYELWKRTRDLAVERGNFVLKVISQYRDCKNLTVLDLGCGEGGTSAIFSENNNVVSLDINKIKLLTLPVNNKIIGNIDEIPFKSGSFNIIILQDVIEHLSLTNEFFDSLYSLLRKDGLIYLSTPNKYSIINFISDPHWNFPFISVLERETIRKYFLKYFRKAEVNRSDIAQLLSLKELYSLSSNNFEIKLNTKFATEELLKENPGIIWSRFHIKLLKIILNLGLSKILFYFTNDKRGFINNFITPSFYIVLFKKSIIN